MAKTTHGTYQVYHRTWWKHNPEWPNGLEPHCGTKYVIGYADDEAEARQMCKDWNEEHDEGELSDKAEYSSSY